MRYVAALLLALCLCTDLSGAWGHDRRTNEYLVRVQQGSGTRIDNAGQERLARAVSWISARGEWDNVVVFPLAQNAGTGSTAYSWGGAVDPAPTGTLINGPTWVADGLTFDRSAERYVQTNIPANWLQNRGTGSVAARSRLTGAAGTTRRIIHVTNRSTAGTNNPVILLNHSSSNNFAALARTQADEVSTRLDHIYGPSSEVLNEWVNAQVISDPSTTTGTASLNGVVVATADIVGPTFPDEPREFPLLIGAQPAGGTRNAFEGQIQTAIFARDTTRLFHPVLELLTP